ncbi:hypothetical protein KKF05_00500 [Patescibacteria group bacterium]|nr:hypothetical protein [Patescibacteria group bacterium]MBU1028712.1 hypothetical protein [Patescibacteria group bacterium]
MNNQSPDLITKSVLAVLVWFDVFDYALTAVEIARFSALFTRRVSIDEVLTALANHPQVAEQNGYYYLCGREICVTQRLQRFRTAESKFRRARFMARLFGLLPAVKLVALCNSLAVANAEEGSDIDFFVVCRPGTLWLTRLILTAPLIVLNLRPTPANQKDKICLSFLVSETALNMSRLQCGEDDPYMRFWVETLQPLYDAGGLFEKFRQENEWVTRQSSATDGLFENPAMIVVGSDQTRPRSRSWIEQLMRRLQLWHFPPAIKSLANLDSRVIISDDILKFHVNDRRELYRQIFRQRLAVLMSKT